METFGILMEQIGFFVIYIVIGVCLVRVNVFNAETLEPLSKFVLKLGLPVLLFINTVNGVSRETLFTSSSILIITTVLYLLLFWLAKGLEAIFGLKGDRGQVYRALSMFGNIGFMGIPIISSIYPENGMLYISVFTIVDQLALWTIGVKLTTPGEKGRERFNPWKLVNPATVAIILAVLCVLCRFHLPRLLNIALGKIGATATPMAMIYLGGVFGCINIRKYIVQLPFYGIVAVKMLLFPVAVYFLLGHLPISEEIRMTLTLVTAMPSMSSVVMMAKASGSEGDFAMGGIFVTTLCSIVTLPFVCWILQSVAL